MAKQFLIYIRLLTLFFCGCTSVSEKNQKQKSGKANNQMVRLSKIVVDSTQLENYKQILKEEAQTSMRVEPGVLTLYAVSEQANPTHFTILEIYADTAAYRSHLTTPHFQRYKTGTINMVKSLQLVDSDPLIPGMKIK